MPCHAVMGVLAGAHPQAPPGTLRRSPSGSHVGQCQLLPPRGTNPGHGGLQHRCEPGWEEGALANSHPPNTGYWGGGAALAGQSPLPTRWGGDPGAGGEWEAGAQLGPPARLGSAAPGAATEQRSSRSRSRSRSLHQPLLQACVLPRGRGRVAAEPLGSCSKRRTTRLPALLGGSPLLGSWEGPRVLLHHPAVLDPAIGLQPSRQSSLLPLCRVTQHLGSPAPRAEPWPDPRRELPSPRHPSSLLGTGSTCPLPLSSEAAWLPAMGINCEVSISLIASWLRLWGKARAESSGCSPAPLSRSPKSGFGGRCVEQEQGELHPQHGPQAPAASQGEGGGGRQSEVPAPSLPTGPLGKGLHAEGPVLHCRAPPGPSWLHPPGTPCSPGRQHHPGVGGAWGDGGCPGWGAGATGALPRPAAPQPRVTQASRKVNTPLPQLLGREQWVRERAAPCPGHAESPALTPEHPGLLLVLAWALRFAPHHGFPPHHGRAPCHV